VKSHKKRKMKNKNKTWPLAFKALAVASLCLGLFAFENDFAIGSDLPFSPVEERREQEEQEMDRAKIRLEVEFEGEGIKSENGEVFIDTMETSGARGIMKVYVGAIFKFAAGLIVVIAVIMIIIGGFEMMFKSSSGDVSTGKERITQALLGIVLVFLSGLILHTINPTFFTFGPESTISPTSTTGSAT